MGRIKMAITDVNEVVIEYDVWNPRYEPFIVAKLTDGDTEKLIVRCYRNCAVCQDTFEFLQSELQTSGLIINCIGGGRIKTDCLYAGEVNTMDIWDQSATFGQEPDREQTVRMVQAAFPEFRVSSS